MSRKNEAKTNYDNEVDIIQEIHELDSKECKIISDFEGSHNFQDTISVLGTILADDYLKKWKDNSASLFPPDFLNDSDSLMLEVMRIDDHYPDGKKNPVLVKEKQMHKDLQPLLKHFPNIKHVFCNAVTDLPTEEDHNYRNYYKSFKRTINKHAERIESTDPIIQIIN